MGKEIILKNVRISYPHLFTPVQYKGAGDFKYNANFIVKKGTPAFALVEKTIKEVALEAWQKKAESRLAAIKHDKKSFCWMDGITKGEGPEYVDAFNLSSANKARPAVVDKVSNGAVHPVTGKPVPAPLTADSGKPYGGCYVNAKVEIYAMDKNGPQIFASLKAVQFESDGDAFGGSAPGTAEGFDALEGSDAPAMDDDCPF